MEQGQCEMIYGHCYYLRITEFGDNNGGGRIGVLFKILFNVEFESYLFIALYPLLHFPVF